MSRKKKILIGVSILAIILLSFVGGNVLAKYQSQVTGRGEASVATWHFAVDGDTEKIQTISLTKGCDESTLIGGKIAPGTSGTFYMLLDANGSEVGIDYTVQFLNEKEKPANLKFEYDGVKYDNISDLEPLLAGTINANDDNRLRNIAVSWVWDYETGSTKDDIAANDAIDTQDAMNFLNYSFDVVITGTQMMPQE